ncbi:D-alanyl-D-alanine carboxypeptidase family protein [Fructilactobacillus sp. Tb1]|uniref:D-alanyl-D-alanine carboxypeptidase family protein n=1 Tax=Fructilactobacillus sp. Tb1 TaxID=3422304 RepID=UPI003D2B85C3
MKFKKFFIGSFVTAGTFLVINTGHNANAAIFTPNVQSKAAILVNTKTGQVIASKNDTQRYPIASVSKLIVVYMVEQQIQEGKLKRTDTVQVPRRILHFSQNTSIANIPMQPKAKYTVEDLEKAALLPSSNAAAMALAHKVSGSQSQYYEDAEKLLDSWGIKNVSIYSSSGLRNGDMGEIKSKHVNDNAENELSARELALIATKLVNKYPHVLDITKHPVEHFPNGHGGQQDLVSTDKLLGTSRYHFKGLKTGTSSHNGVNFVGYSTLKQQPVVSVVLNAAPGVNFKDTESMMEQADAKTTTIKHNVKSVKVDNADTDGGEIAIKPQTPTAMFASKRLKANDLKSKFNEADDLSAPLKKNEFVGNQTLNFKDHRYNDFIEKQPKIKYVSKANVEKTWMIVSMYRKFIGLF